MFIPINRFTVSLSVVFIVTFAFAILAMWIDPEKSVSYDIISNYSLKEQRGKILIQDANGLTEKTSEPQQWGAFNAETGQVIVSPVFHSVDLIIFENGYRVFVGSFKKGIRDSIETKTYYVINACGQITLQRELSWNSYKQYILVKFFNEMIIQFAPVMKDQYGNWDHKNSDTDADYFYADGSELSPLMRWWCRNHINVDRFFILIGFIFGIYVIGWVLPSQWRLFNRESEMIE